MAKQGMKRPQRTHTQPRNDAPAVSEIQGKAKSGKRHARAIIAGTGLARDNLENDITAADLQDL